MIRLNYLQSKNLSSQDYIDQLISFCLKHFDERDLIVDFGCSQLISYKIPKTVTPSICFADEPISSPGIDYRMLAKTSFQIDWESLPTQNWRNIFLVDFEKGTTNEIKNLINHTMKRSRIIGINRTNVISDLILKLREWKQAGASMDDSCIMASLQTGLGLETVEEVERYMEQSQNVKMNVIDSIEEIKCQIDHK